MKEFNIVTSKDINGRMALNIAYALNSFSGNIWFVSSERCINAKSILGILSLGIKKNENITIKTDNVNIDEDKIKNIINN